MPKKVALRINAYAIVTRAIEEGVEAGWRRAHKHTDEPTGSTICAHIEAEVFNALSEVMTFSKTAPRRVRKNHQLIMSAQMKDGAEIIAKGWESAAAMLKEPSMPPETPKKRKRKVN